MLRLDLLRKQLVAASLLVLPLALLSVLVVGGASAQPLVVGGGSTYWTRTQTISTTAHCVPVSGSDGHCALFPAGDGKDHAGKAVWISADAAAVCAWVGEGSGTSLALSTAGWVTDSGTEFGSGQGAVITLAAGATARPEAPRRSTLRAAGTPGTRSGVCSVAVTNAAESPQIYAPCDANSDCTAYGGGTCTLAPTNAQRSLVGSFLICRSISGTGNVSAEKVALSPVAIASFTGTSLLRETSGPTSMVVGAVADGECLSRSGSTIVGAACSGGGGGGDVPSTRTISAGSGLTGGGDLSANRTLAIDTGGVTSAMILDGTIALGDMAASAAGAAAGTPSLRAIGSTALTCAAGNDSRLSDSRTPTAHASSHLPGGSDALTVATPSSVGTANAAGSAASFSRSDHVHAIATDAVDSAQIAANAVGSSEIAADAVGSSEIAADAVGSSEIAAAAVGASEIDTAAVPRVAGLGIGLAGVSGALAATSISLPSAPSAGNLTLFSHTIAGQDLLAMRSATRTTILGFCPAGSVRFGLIPMANAASVAGVAIPAGIAYGAAQYTVSGTGTGSFPSPSGSTFRDRAPHLHIVAGTAANSYADAFNGSSNTVGVGLVNRVDGFRWMTIVNDETNITTNQNDFVGFGAASGAVNDSGTREGVLFGYRPSSASTDNWQFMTRNTTTLTSVDLGSNCQRSTTSVYMFAMIAEPGASEIGYEAWNVTDPSAPVLCARGTQTNTLPTASTLLMKENYSQHTSGTTPTQHNIYAEEGCIGLGLQ